MERWRPPEAWLIVPHTGTNTVYVGDDGGIWRSEDQGPLDGTSLTSLTSTINAGGLQIATLYQLAVKQDATAGVTIEGLRTAECWCYLHLRPLRPLPAGAQPWSDIRRQDRRRVRKSRDGDGRNATEFETILSRSRRTAERLGRSISPRTFRAPRYQSS
jgi:hypothetical protein